MPTKTSTAGSELFIVDNSDEDWKVRKYLHDWCQLSKGFDIATGYFEIGSLLGLGDEWKKVDKIRILMGADVSKRTRRAFETAQDALLPAAIKRLDQSVEGEKESDDFLAGVPAIVEGLRSKQIECRIYRKDKFHAKAYITHARLDVVGSFGLVGSSNFTAPGLTDNVELNVQISGTPVSVLQEWYERHWNEAEDVTPEILNTIERHVLEYSPFDVYAKSLHELFRDSSYTGAEWEVVGAEQGGSKVFSNLDRYQQEGYRSLLRIADQHRGAFLCDGVGLGKTFIGLMLLERLVIHDRRRVALIVPKSGRIAVWEKTIRKYCPELLSGFLPFKVLNHTDLIREPSGDVNWPQVMEDIRTQADVVVIDEAHNFRNPGIAGRGRLRPSRYRKLFEILAGPDGTKQLYLLTATPINNSLDDFRHMAELFTRNKEDYFAQSLGIHNLRAHFRQMEIKLHERVSRLTGESTEVAEDAVIDEAEKVLDADRIFRALVVQRSRAYVRESQKQVGGNQALFPDREPPEVVGYSIKKTYGELLDMIETAFSKQHPLFVLPIYYPLAYYKGTDIDPFKEGRQKQVVGLIRTLFLKRFESSAHAFLRSCQRLLVKLLTWAEVHANSDAADRVRLERWKRKRAKVIGYLEQLPLQFAEDEKEAEEDLVTAEMLEDVEELDRGDYDVARMMSDVLDDLEQLAEFLEELRRLDSSKDDKLAALVRLLTKDPVLKKHKCLIFTEFADTARYLARELRVRSIEGVESIDGSSKLDRGEVITRFAPYYNGSSSAEVGDSEIRILISTDVLSEGLNLQDATRLINYDIHWNPVRLMQRIGRVDRRMNPDFEMRLTDDHPERKALRGKVKYWNFLPPAELNRLLTLYTRVTHKVLRISETFGIEGQKLLRPDDHLNALREFNQAFEGRPSKVEEMRLEYRQLLADDPGLEARLCGLPLRLYSGRERIPDKVRGVFFCFALPAQVAPASAEPEWTTDTGAVEWYLLDLDSSKVVEGAEAIHGHVRSLPDTARRCRFAQADLVEARKLVEKHIKNTYLKRIDAPVGVRPVLKCWMELNAG
jgi:hypothetical protein